MHVPLPIAPQPAFSVPSACPAAFPPAGYGNTGPQQCYLAAALISIQGVSDLLLNAVILGLVFAKVCPFPLRFRTGHHAALHFRGSGPVQQQHPLAALAACYNPLPPAPCPPCSPRRRQVASPKHRAFSIYISDSSVITRRDGILKFMFRVADIRRTQVAAQQGFLWLRGGCRRPVAL